jgi:acetoacetyl-CoA reductase
MGRLSSRVALVTGASRGIGEAIARRFAAEGAAVAVTARTVTESDNLLPGSITTTLEAILDAGGTAVAIPADLSSADDRGRLVDAVERQLGPIDVLVNNAGITRDTTMHRMSFEQWNAVIQTNLSSCFNMSKAVIDGMRDRHFGRIVNVGSINGQAGQYGQVNYAAAKSGIHGFTKALAQEGAARGITVNAVAPGYVDTDMVRAVPADVLEKIIARIPVGRLGKAEDIARTVLFLVADDADFITGSTLSVNGGQHMY